MLIHTAYGERAKKTKYIPGKSRTKQAMKDEVDINFIVNKYNQTGTLEHLKEYEGEYATYDNINFHDAMNTVTAATQMFDSLPANLRAKFDNDPGQFLEFATEPKNHNEMVELGLAYPSIEEEALEEPLEPDKGTKEVVDPTVTT